MNISTQLEKMLSSSRLEKDVERFQVEYLSLVEQGFIHRKGYNLADVDVIGRPVPAVTQSDIGADVVTYRAI